MNDDVISRQAIKEKLQEHYDFFVNAYDGFENMPSNVKLRIDEITNCIAEVVNMPAVQPEPISEAYTKAVWIWLISYQIKVEELKGRYTPYEVLSWVANDWRKEHGRSDKQTGGD